MDIVVPMIESRCLSMREGQRTSVRDAHANTGIPQHERRTANVRSRCVPWISGVRGTLNSFFGLFRDPRLVHAVLSSERAPFSYFFLSGLYQGSFLCVSLSRQCWRPFACAIHGPRAWGQTFVPSDASVEGVLKLQR